MTTLVRFRLPGCDVMLCDVMLCDVMLCDVMLCDVMLCDVMLQRMFTVRDGLGEGLLRTRPPGWPNPELLWDASAVTDLSRRNTTG
jgi:hypothetical protein